jgi:hypothetical protein
LRQKIPTIWVTALFGLFLGAGHHSSGLQFERFDFPGFIVAVYIVKRKVLPLGPIIVKE